MSFRVVRSIKSSSVRSSPVRQRRTHNNTRAADSTRSYLQLALDLYCSPSNMRLSCIEVCMWTYTANLTVCCAAGLPPPLCYDDTNLSTKRREPNHDESNLFPLIRYCCRLRPILSLVLSRSRPNVFRQPLSFIAVIFNIAPE